MAARYPLHVLFTMDCHPAATRAAPEGPRSWEQSAAAIDGFCLQLLRAGYAATLFLTPGCADAHAPLLEEMAELGIELGLLVQPQSLDGGGYRRYLGQYDQETQRAILARAITGFQDALGRRPESVRPAMYSANDETFPVLLELGFRQGSVSSPGRRIPRHGAIWTDATPDPHHVDPRSRLRAGALPFLEVPVTTDPDRVRGGLAADLTIENGEVDPYHRPLIEGQLRRMDANQTPFRALCFVTRNVFAYHAPADRLAQTLQAIIDYLETLEERYELIPSTLATTHRRFRERLG